jgi:succinoglycan biosynthesis transport protein ExoP
MELREYVRVLRAHWLLIVVSVALCTGAAGALAWTRTAVYAAQTQLFVSTRPTSDLSETYAGGLFAQQRVRSYIELVSAPRVTAAVINRLRLPYSVEELQPRIQASIPPDTVLIDITVEDASPLRAKAIADALGVEFPRFIAELETPADGRAPPVSVSVAQPSQLPSAPVSPNKLLYLLLGAQLGLLLGVAGAVVREALGEGAVTVADDRRWQSGQPTTAGRLENAADREATDGEAVEIRRANVAGERPGRFP